MSHQPRAVDPEPGLKITVIPMTPGPGDPQAPDVRELARRVRDLERALRVLTDQLTRGGAA